MIGFDGNPQGFRLISFLAGADNFGLNLTNTLLLSTVKYPWNEGSRPTGKKLGIFSQDYSTYQQACTEVGWNAGAKFPFAHLMDIADEIAYSMSDLEDGLEKSIIDEDDLKKEFGADKFPDGALKPFVSFKTKVINKAVEEAAQKFTANIGPILDGQSIDLIDKDGEVGQILSNVKRLANLRIYSHPSAEQVELAGRRVVKGLLDHFGELLTLSESDFEVLTSNDISEIRSKKLDFQARLFRRLPKGYCEKYRTSSRGNEGLRRAHFVVDFISGMTDDFALETYQILEGIRIK